MSTAAAPAPEVNTLADYRAMREKGQVPLDKPVETKPAETPAAETPAADEKPAADDSKVSTAAPDEDAGGEESKQQQPDKEARKRERLDNRFKELTRERDEALRQLNEERARAGGGAPKPAEQAKPAAAASDPNDPEPQLEKYAAGDYIQYQKDLARWAAREESRIAAAKEAQRKTADTQKAAMSAWDAKQSKAREAHEDFDDVALDRNLTITPVMGQAITDAENGAEVLYYLGEHPKEAARIAALSSPVAQIREIGKLELKLSSPPAEDKAPEAKPVSQAPKPVKALAGAAAQSAAVKNLEGMTQAEYRKYRESGQIK